MEFLNHSSFEGEKFQLMGRVMGFSLCQTPTDIGYDSIHPIVTSLIEESPQATPASVNMELKKASENQCRQE